MGNAWWFPTQAHYRKPGVHPLSPDACCHFIFLCLSLSLCKIWKSHHQQDYCENLSELMAYSKEHQAQDSHCQAHTTGCGNVLVQMAPKACISIPEK